jgi:predicted nucleic acid-binding protein
MTRFIADASFAAAWCFEDEATAETDRYLHFAAVHGILVPALWQYEIVNFLRMAERRLRITVAEADLRLAALLKLVVEVEEVPLHMSCQNILAIARTFNITAYDASYIDLAQRTALPLASNDTKMISVAKYLGLLIVTP